MAATRRYREVVVRGLVAAGSEALSPVSGPTGPVLLIALTSEQPLCGGFNHAVVERVMAAHRELLGSGHKVELVAAGQRGGRVIAAKGTAPDHIEPGATSLSGLRDLVRRLATRADHGYATGAFAAVDVVYARYQSVSEQVPTLERVLPIDPAVLTAAQAVRPMVRFYRYLADPQLVAGLVGQFAYITLYRAAAESYASEQASRLVAMDGATRNTGKMVEELAALERRERQHEITQQVLELSASRLTGDGA
jgi:F-type H+-transporting ATPase subunit gamma